MATIANALKVFKFVIEVDGLEQFLVQKIDLPELEIDSTEHGAENYKVKTPGMINVSDLTLEKLKFANQADNWAHEWLQQAQNIETGGGQTVDVFKRDLIVRELSEDGSTTIYTHVLEGAWCKKVSQNSFDRTSSDNVMETVVISVDKYYRR